MRHSSIAVPCCLDLLEPRLLLSLPGFADLAVENLVAPATGEIGATVRVEYDVYNRGDTDTSNGWMDMITLGRSIVPMFGVMGVPEIEDHANPLAAGDHVHVVKDVTVPIGPAGSMHLQVTANFNESYVDESGQDANNFLRTTLRVTAPPPVDLRPLSLTPGKSVV